MCLEDSLPDYRDIPTKVRHGFRRLQIGGRELFYMEGLFFLKMMSLYKGDVLSICRKPCSGKLACGFTPLANMFSAYDYECVRCNTDLILIQKISHSVLQ